MKEKEQERGNTRVQMDLQERSMQRLMRLKEVTEAASYAEVVRNALRLYEAMIMEAEGGATFFVQKPGGELVEQRIFGS